MGTRNWIRLLLGLSLTVLALVDRPADAEETRRTDDAYPGAASAPPPDKSFLDALAKDLRLSFSPWSEASLTVALAPSQWSLSGARPYAALSTRVLRSVTDGLTGLALPNRESETDLAHGLGLGAGITWRLSDRLDLFGQYLFRATPSTGVPTGNPTLRPDLETPGLKGGFSIKF